jgi:Fic family protein
VLLIGYIGPKNRQMRPMTETEHAYRIEPCLLDQYTVELADTISELVKLSTALGQRLHPRTAASLAELVRVMNCYYSNLIEGHNTRPRDIERALHDQLDSDPKRRELQLEAAAHIRVQRLIDQRFAADTLGEPASAEFIRWVHREFYQDAPASMLRIEHDAGAFVMVPGEFRSEAHHDNVVGRHRPPASPFVDAFMAYFEQRYRLASLGSAARVAAVAAAHHRLNFIHPFSDGNGRVSRLVSHAMALQAGVGAHGLWSISRGLARGLHDAGEYKRMMDDADSPRRGDLDGRGNLSREALVHFVTWFCRVAVDQVRFMTELFDLDALRDRLTAYVRGPLGGNEAAWLLVEEVLRRGEMPRGEATRVTGRPERTAREVLRKLIDAGLLTSETAKGPVQLRFSPSSVDALFPRLFPAQVV